ncbi:Uma2 family endonuclease [Baaleninema simplex]|uniref:Uma2 family endonuclease n=1 Tax=Baaleninema simplex TaxID=2862350 RepID=UPI00034BF3DF|nr:Uma2 family endonuclease [Baaleninema simplex]
MTNAFTLNSSALHLTEEQFFQLCQDNREVQFERNANGDLVIMPPTGGETGYRNGRITQQLFNWIDAGGTGIAFDSSTGFILLNGANRSPDVAWIASDRWNALTPEQKQRFLPLCPDFVVELRSPSDNLETLQRKMQEYRDNGTRLGWLLDPSSKTIEIYRRDRPIEVVQNPDELLGETVLPGFSLKLDRIW